MSGLTESVVEDVALTRFESLGYAVAPTSFDSEMAFFGNGMDT